MKIRKATNLFQTRIQPLGSQIWDDDENRFARSQPRLLLLVAHQVEHGGAFDRQDPLPVAPDHRNRTAAFREQVYREAIANPHAAGRGAIECAVPACCRPSSSAWAGRRNPSARSSRWPSSRTTASRPGRRRCSSSRRWRLRRKTSAPCPAPAHKPRRGRSACAVPACDPNDAPRLKPSLGSHEAKGGQRRPPSVM